MKSSLLKFLFIGLLIFQYMGFQAQEISVTYSKTDVSCNGGSNGNLSLSPSGGHAPYGFSWSNGSTTSSISNLSAGTYSVTVHDSPVTVPFDWSFQTTDASHVVLFPLSAVLVDGLPLQTGDYVGAFFLNTSTQTYQCGGYVQITGMEGDYSALSAWAYSQVPYVDQNGQSQIITFPGFAQGEELRLKVYRSSTGSVVDMAEVFTSQIIGFPAFPNMGTFASGGISGLSALTGASFLTWTGSFQVSQPTQLQIGLSAGSISCFGGQASVVISATGGTTPYTGTGTFSTPAGISSFTVTDANNCQASGAVTLTQPTELDPAVSADPILCYGGLTNVVVSATGGTSPYSGTGSFQLAAGAHSFSVSDANGCQVVEGITLTQPTLLEASASFEPISVQGGSTTVTVVAAGGTPPYSGTGDFILSAGIYQFTVTDHNLCSQVVDVSLVDPTTYSLDLKFFLQGLYNSATGQMNEVMDLAYDEEMNPIGIEPKFGAGVADQVTVQLVNSEDVSEILFSAADVAVDLDGQCSLQIPSSLTGMVYIVVKTRNHIETWSAEPLELTGTAQGYDFTTAASQAFGNNQKSLPGGVYAFFGGDVDQDGYVMIFDLLSIFNLSTTFAQGFYPSDITGNSYVDIFDLLICFNNSKNFVSISRPY